MKTRWAISSYAGRDIGIYLNSSKAFEDTYEGLMGDADMQAFRIEVAASILGDERRFWQVVFHEFVHCVESTVAKERLDSTLVDDCTQLAITMGHAMSEFMCNLRFEKVAPPKKPQARKRKPSRST